MDSAFLNLVRGNRLSQYMGLTMEGETPHRFSSDYTFVEIPLGEVMDITSEKVLRKNASLKAGATVRLIPACRIENRVYKCLVSVNPAVQKFCPGAPTLFLIEPGDGIQPGVTVTVGRDCSLADLTAGWLVRLYLIA